MVLCGFFEGLGFFLVVFGFFGGVEGFVFWFYLLLGFGVIFFFFEMSLEYIVHPPFNVVWYTSKCRKPANFCFFFSFS